MKVCGELATAHWSWIAAVSTAHVVHEGVRNSWTWPDEKTRGPPHLSLHRQGDADADVGLAVHEVGGPVQRVHQPRRRVRQRVRGALRRRPLLPCAPVAIASCAGCAAQQTHNARRFCSNSRTAAPHVHHGTWPACAHTPVFTANAVQGRQQTLTDEPVVCGGRPQALQQQRLALLVRLRDQVHLERKQSVTCGKLSRHGLEGVRGQILTENSPCPPGREALQAWS